MFKKKKLFYKKKNFEDTGLHEAHLKQLRWQRAFVTVAVVTYLVRAPVEVLQCVSAWLHPHRHSLLPPGEKGTYNFSFDQFKMFHGNINRFVAPIQTTLI